MDQLNKFSVAKAINLANADSYRSTSLDTPVKILKSDKDDTPCTTIVAQFRKNSEWVKKFRKNHVSFYKKVNDSYDAIPFTQYERDIETAAKALISLGVKPHNAIAAIGFNSYEWVVMNMAAIFCGGVIAGLYTTNSADLIEYCIQKIEIKVVLVENTLQRKKLEEKFDSLKDQLVAIIQYSELESISDNYEQSKGLKSDKPVIEYDNGIKFFKWTSFMKLSKSSLSPEATENSQPTDLTDSDYLDKELEKRIENMHPNMCCTVVFTSGTTSLPKAVMLSHDNIIFVTAKLSKKVKIATLAEHIIVSYLPFSHIAANLFDIHMNYALVTTIYFAQPDAFKGSLKFTLQDARPTIFFGVPRVYEKFNMAIVNIILQSGTIKKNLLNWGLNKGRLNFFTQMNLLKEGDPNWNKYESICFKLADKIVLQKIRKNLGMDRCQRYFFGAAPLSGDVMQMFLNLGMFMCNIYGLSECSGPHLTVNDEKYAYNSCGDEFDEYVTTKFDKASYDDLYIDAKKDDEKAHNATEKYVTIEDEKIDSNKKNKIKEYGELLISGRHVFMGYCNDENNTNKCFQGIWFQTGDVGERHDNGCINITGRVKDIIITSGGENVAPIPIEDTIKKFLPVISNVMVVGENKPYLCALLTLKTEVDTNTLCSTDELTYEALDWCKKFNVTETNANEIYNEMSPAFVKAIDEGISDANNEAISQPAKIKRWRLLRRDFSIGTGEIGPTMKRKNHTILEKYSDLINEIYTK
ncbi:hypothetical protein A3Q56_03617 [Intoshia linei]|uniref:long-chain-fatty-acid--CoA ligase n=1 Tax=Intoshia linei TaxID=1819745 RepID=A0A177B2V5_9BILA|nr:hypothetical protein A3Q56_03617 [Intoshia linei]